MTDTGADNGAIETRADIGDGPEADVKFWRMQLELAEKEDREWVSRGDKIIRRYRDERNESRSSSKFNVLWSNVQTLKPAMYARTPKPDVERRFRDADPAGRMASMILERALTYTTDVTKFDHVMRSCVEDQLLPGRGTARVRYVPKHGDEQPDPDQEGETFRPVVWEEAVTDYVFWKDFRHSPSRSWQEVWWVAFRSYLTRDQLVDRFGSKIGKAVTLDFAPSGLDDRDGAVPDSFKKATVWEVWHKSKAEVIWLASSYDEPLDVMDDPLGLSEFFPCPMPLYATTTTDKLVPIPDFAEYQDQADELDNLTARIARLTRALRVAGVYPGSAKAELQELMNDGTDGRLIAIEDWVQHGERGGMSKMIDYLPIEQIAKVLIQCYDARDRTKQVLYEITGIADIIRGATAPSETATAQQIKTQFATLRLSERQRDVARFARDLFRLLGEIMALHFSPDTLRKMTGLPGGDQQVPPPTPLMPPMGMGAPQMTPA